MKTLYLVRHAKSSWDLNDLPDIDRALNERGFRDAHLIGEKLSEKAIMPDLIVSSPANRAITTALIIARKIRYLEDKIVLRRNLYESSVEEYFNEISRVKENMESVMLFGHNPTISDTAKALAERLEEDMPTCAVVKLEFKISSWKDILQSRKTGKLSFHIFPKLLKSQ